jgi:hypothetical protein
MGLAHVELAPFVGAYDLVGVGDRCGPVEALVERVAHEGARCRVMATHAYVDVPDELPAMGKGMQGCRTPDAAQLYSSLSITVNDLAFLAMRLASVRSEGSSPRSIQVRYLLCQSSARGGGLCLHGIGLVYVEPSSRESTNASFEGSSSMGSALAGLEGAPDGSP